VLRKGNTGFLTSRDMAFLFEETGIKLKKTLESLQAHKWLVRAIRGVYVYIG
jgi:hypothetical protein